MNIGTNEAEPSVIDSMTVAWADMCQLPRIVWAQWCNAAIDMWVSAFIGERTIPTLSDPSTR